MKNQTLTCTSYSDLTVVYVSLIPGKSNKKYVHRNKRTGTGEFAESQGKKNGDLVHFGKEEMKVFLGLS